MYDATFGELYDLIHAGLVDDVAYVRRFARAAGGALLELGCGSGRLLLAPAADGVPVTGVDNAPAMLARAQAAAAAAGVAARVTLLHDDMTQLTQVRDRFGAIVIGSNTIMHLTADQLRPMLRAAWRSATPAAQLLIDTANPLLLADADSVADWALERLLHRPDGTTVTQYSSWTHDAEAQTLVVTWRFEQAGSEPYYATTTYHYHYPHMLVDALQACGWQPVQMSGDYDDTPYAEESERLIVTARAL